MNGDHCICIKKWYEYIPEAEGSGVTFYEGEEYLIWERYIDEIIVIDEYGRHVQADINKFRKHFVAEEFVVNIE